MKTSSSEECFGWASGPALRVVEEYLKFGSKISEPASAEHHAIPNWRLSVSAYAERSDRSTNRSKLARFMSTRPSTTLADYSRRCSLQIHFRQCGHRFGGGGRAMILRMA